VSTLENLAVVPGVVRPADQAMVLEPKDTLGVDPDEIRGYFLSAWAYLGLNRVDDARAILNAGLQRNPSFTYLHNILADAAYTQDDIPAMEKQEALVHDQPDLAMNVNTRHGDIAASHGQIEQARDAYAKKGQVAHRLQLKDAEAESLNAQGWMFALFGDAKQSIEAANAALAISQGYLVKFYAASDMAVAGENQKALQLASEVAKQRPLDTLV